ncbi:hypothetical protein Adt_35768 [Abeliophyllum distichum]|uniref:Uncharacterized protein n=1 Tax=Abeliophyllum distichum TaxID=126358 RepID=A0ABD1QFP1_9LAMI
MSDLHNYLHCRVAVMNFNHESIDDELEILETLNTIASSSRNTDGIESFKKKAKLSSSDVWNHFEKIGMKDGKEKCKCIDCGKVYGCPPVGGLLTYSAIFQSVH